MHNSCLQVPLTSADLTSSRELPVSAASGAIDFYLQISLVLFVFLCFAGAQKLKVRLRSVIDSFFCLFMLIHN